MWKNIIIMIMLLSISSLYYYHKATVLECEHTISNLKTMLDTEKQNNNTLKNEIQKQNEYVDNLSKSSNGLKKVIDAINKDLENEGYKENVGMSDTNPNEERTIEWLKEQLNNF